MAERGDVREAPAFKSMEATMKDFPQLATLIKGADIRDFRSCDTGSYPLPGLEIFTSAQPVDRINTDGGRQFKFDRNGDTTYTMTNKDYKGLYDTVRDYMKARDGRTPTPDQIRKMAEQVAKDNGIKDINNIRQGTTLKFPGPETAPRYNRQSDVPPTDYRYPPGYRQSDAPPQDYRYQYPPGHPEESWQRKPPAKAPDTQFVTPPGTQDSKDGKEPDGVRWRKQTGEKDNHDGTKTTEFKGSLDDGSSLLFGVGRTTFTTSETKDNDGRLLHRKIDYENDTVKMQIKDAKGQNVDIQVKQVETRWNPSTNSYDTTLTDKDGKQHRIRTGPDGRQLPR